MTNSEIVSELDAFVFAVQQSLRHDRAEIRDVVLAGISDDQHPASSLIVQ